MTLEPWFLLLVLVVGLSFKALFTAAEWVVASADARRLEEEADEGSATAEWALKTLRDRERLLAGALAGETQATVAVATVLALLVLLEAPGMSWVLAGLGLGALMALVGDLLPRAWAQPRTYSALPGLLLPLRFVTLAFFPFVWLVVGLSRIFARILQTSDTLRAFVTREELRTVLAETEGGEIRPLERQMLSRVLDFSEITVEEVMVPLIDVHAVPDTASLREALRMFVAEGHSRLPVFSGRVDNIVGVLHAFDVLYAEALEQPVTAHMRPGKYVPETSSIDKALEDLQKSRVGMAVVVDEYGGAVGVIALEDILEQIVGDIEDEHDRRAPMLRRTGPREYVVSARVKLEKLSQVLDVSLPEGDYETVGGMLMTELGRIPGVGERWQHEALVFTVRKATERVIEEVGVEVRGGTAEGPAGDGHAPQDFS